MENVETISDLMWPDIPRHAKNMCRYAKNILKHARFKFIK